MEREKRTGRGRPPMGGLPPRFASPAPAKMNNNETFDESPPRLVMCAKSPSKNVEEERQPTPATILSESNIIDKSEIMADGETPQAIEEVEVVLNRRGIPARQRKRNRFYFDDDLVTPDSLKKTPKKIKQEPVDSSYEDLDNAMVVHDHEEIVTTEITSSFEMAASSGKRPKGRPPGSGNRKDLNSRSPTNSGAVRKRQKSRDSFDEETPTPKSVGRPSKAFEQLTKVTASVGRPPNLTRISKPEKIKKIKIKPLKEKKIKKIKIKKSMDHANASNNKSVPAIRIKREPGEIVVRPIKHENREKERVRRDSERGVKGKRDKELQSRDRDRDREYAMNHEKRHRNRRASSPSTTYAIGIISDEQSQRPTIDKKIAQDISLRLRNLLKLPKAHKWVCYEWFYSNIDKTLFEGENDFQICLKESFPQLKARKLTRVEWCKIRRLMGKPRRCSNAFFEEEREELSRRRQKIRMIQQRKVTDFNYKELPDEIPLQLVIGTKVTARLRRPQDGLFTGTIEGVDTSNNTYRITFDRAGLGTHSIPDYEVLSNDQPETVSTSSFALKIPRRSFGPFSGAFKFQNSSFMQEDMLYGGFPKSPFPVDGMLGGFPIRLLDMIVRLSKLLKAKREKILHLKELNVEAEKMRSYSKPFNEEYRLRYARCVLDLDSMNKEMSAYLEVIQQYCLEIAPDHGVNQMIVPEHVQETSKQEASLIVDTYNSKQNRNLVNGPKNLSLIATLTSLMLQVKALSSGDRNLYELKSIKDTMREIKASLEGKNVQWFQDRIEIPMNRIQAGLCLSLPSKPF